MFGIKVPPDAALYLGRTVVVISFYSAFIIIVHSTLRVKLLLFFA